MTAQQAILSLGMVTLGCCGAVLVLIHDRNPLLKGLHWMGGALLMGSVAAGMTLAAEAAPWMGPLAAFCTLLTFICCYRADRYLLEQDVTIGRQGVALLCAQAVVSGAALARWLGPAAAAGWTSLLVAAQLGCSAALARRQAAGKQRQAARLSAWLMTLLAVANGLCALGEGADLLTGAGWAGPLHLVVSGLFVLAAITLAFSFFWRTTTKLSVDLEYMASTDPLTRVYNRRVFLSWCESEQARSRRLHTPFSLLMVDFDHFKSINDKFGHHVGDQVLCAAVERIQDSVRGIDVLCRWGGEEFCVLLPNASDEATMIVAERVRRNVRLFQLANAQFGEAALADLQLSASIGTATYEGEEDTYAQMLERADLALYEAKHSGRNRVVRSARTRGGAPLAPQLVLEAS